VRLKGLPGTFYKAGRLSATILSEKAKGRLRLLELWGTLRVLGLGYKGWGQALGVSRATLYRWRRRLQSFGPAGLEDGSRAPRRRRRPSWSSELVQAVLDLRHRPPGWGQVSERNLGHVT